jgi:DNA-binding transcriptional ArsR family regulator
LHKILKDETRRKIILLLNEKGSVSYTDLMDALGIVSTGTLNYHLKVLGDLLSKSESGQYTLAERGKLASRLLQEFPEESRQQLGMKPKWWRRFWIEIGIYALISSAISLAAYFLGYTNLLGLYQRIILLIGGIGIVYLIVHVTREVLSKKTQLLLNKIAYTALGVWLGLAASFFGVLLLSLLSTRLGGPSIALLIDNTIEVILVIGVPMILGGIAGYQFGKKRGFRAPGSAL